jgi:hypothetical protein
MATHKPMKTVVITSCPNNLPTKNPLVIGIKKADKEIIMFLPLIDFKISSKLISSPAIITSKKTPKS